MTLPGRWLLLLLALALLPCTAARAAEGFPLRPYYPEVAPISHGRPAQGLRQGGHPGYPLLL